jgi:peptidoglycan/LPS O-acetylase OafA/YrhL
VSHEKRIPCLDGLRGVAAIAVMLFHFKLFYLPQARLSDVVPLVTRAYLGVDLFYMLSGFVMAHVYGRLLALNWQAHWLDFAIARGARIYPAVAATLLTMIIAVTLSNMLLQMVIFSCRSLALQPMLLQQWASDLSWDYPSWSVNTEVEAYIFFVLSANLLVTGRRPLLIAFCCVAIVVGLNISHGALISSHTGFSALLRTLAEFSLGVLLMYRVHSHYHRVSNLTETSNHAFGSVCCCGNNIFRLPYLLCCTTADTVGKLLESSYMRSLGDWPYSIYLWHAPAHYAIMTTLATIGYPVSKLNLDTAYKDTSLN